MRSDGGRIAGVVVVVAAHQQAVEHGMLRHANAAQAGDHMRKYAPWAACRKSPSKTSRCTPW
jgi:hypothetical protein